MHVGSWESTREAFEWHDAKPTDDFDWLNAITRLNKMHRRVSIEI